MYKLLRCTCLHCFHLKMAANEVHRILHLACKECIYVSNRNEVPGGEQVKMYARRLELLSQGCLIEAAQVMSGATSQAAKAARAITGDPSFLDLKPSEKEEAQYIAASRPSSSLDRERPGAVSIDLAAFLTRYGHSCAIGHSLSLLMFDACVPDVSRILGQRQCTLWRRSGTLPTNSSGACPHRPAQIAAPTIPSSGGDNCC